MVNYASNTRVIQQEIKSKIFAATDRIGESNLKSRFIRTQNFKYIRNLHQDFSVIEAATATGH